MTLVELIVAFTILLVLTSMAVPVARNNVRRIKERQLREALHEIRTAIDKYKDMADAESWASRNRTAMAIRNRCRRWWMA